MCKALKSYLVRELLFGCVVAGMFAIAHAESPQLTAETLPAARREAAARKRRVIMNNERLAYGASQTRPVSCNRAQCRSQFRSRCHFTAGIWEPSTKRDSGTRSVRTRLSGVGRASADDGGPDALGTIVDSDSA